MERHKPMDHATVTDPDNRMVWDRKSGGHFESWEAVFNHRASQCGFGIRYNICAPKAGEAHGELVFDLCDPKNSADSCSFRRRFPLDLMKHCSQPFSVVLGSARLDGRSLQGTLCSGPCHQTPSAHLDDALAIPAIRWDLRFSPSSFTHRQLPDVAYRRGLADLNILSPNPATHFSGSVIVGDRRFDFDDEPGSQSHRWSRRSAHTWAWGRCQGFREDPTAYLDVLTLRIRRGPIVSPPITLLSLYLGREVYHFRDIRTAPLTRGKWETGLYRFRAVGGRIKIEGELRCRPEDLIRTDHRTPNGREMFTHSTETADATVRVLHRRSRFGKFRQVLKLSSRCGGHFEYASGLPDDRVERQTIEAIEGIKNR